MADENDDEEMYEAPEWDGEKDAPPPGYTGPHTAFGPYHNPGEKFVEPDAEKEGRELRSRLEFLQRQIDSADQRAQEAANHLKDLEPHIFANEDAPSQAGNLFYVALSSPSGSAGDLTHAVAFVYTVTSIGGTVLGTSIAPHWPSRSQFGKRIAATKGFGYTDNAGAFHLLVALEPEDTGACES